MKLRYATTILSGILLAGCGSSSGDETPDDGAPVVGPEAAVPDVGRVAAVDGFLGVFPESFSVAYDQARDRITLTDEAGSVILTRAAPGEGAFGVYQAVDLTRGTINALFGTTPSGDGAAGVVRAFGVSGSAFSRLSDTQMPSSGTASFSGDYAAQFVTNTSTTPSFVLYGTAAFTADFDAGTISGSITNRETPALSIVSWSDVTLRPTTISDGGFSGTATGGDGSIRFLPTLPPQPFTTTTPGAYSGLFTGANGQEIVGGVRIPHAPVSGAPLTENGAFIAERTGP